MNAAGLRSLFRHHRKITGIKLAHPHRFRHTFASDMVRADMSLPALMQLMGHADIQTTLQYVRITHKMFIWSMRAPWRSTFVPCRRFPYESRASSCPATRSGCNV